MELQWDSNKIEHFRKRPKRADIQLRLRARIVYEHDGASLRARTHHKPPIHATHPNTPTHLNAP